MDSGDKLRTVVCVCWFVCAFHGVTSPGREGVEVPCLHCVSDPWPFVTLSEWEKRDTESESKRS